MVTKPKHPYKNVFLKSPKKDPINISSTNLWQDRLVLPFICFYLFFLVKKTILFFIIKRSNKKFLQTGDKKKIMLSHLSPDHHSMQLQLL